MFKLGGSFAINGGGGPLIGPRERLGRSFADHGFNGESVSGGHLSIRFVVAIMQDVGIRVERTTDAVTAKITDRAQPAGSYVIFDDAANIFIIPTGKHELTRRNPTIVRGLQQMFGGIIDIVAHDEHFRTIAMIAIRIYGHINVDDITLF